MTSAQCYHPITTKYVVQWRYLLSSECSDHIVTSYSLWPHVSCVIETKIKIRVHEQYTLIIMVRANYQAIILPMHMVISLAFFIHNLVRMSMRVESWKIAWFVGLTIVDHDSRFKLTVTVARSWCWIDFHTHSNNWSPLHNGILHISHSWIDMIFRYWGFKLLSEKFVIICWWVRVCSCTCMWNILVQH